MGHSRNVPISLKYTREFGCNCGWRCEGEERDTFVKIKLHKKVCKECEYFNVPKTINNGDFNLNKVIAKKNTYDVCYLQGNDLDNTPIMIVEK